MADDQLRHLGNDVLLYVGTSAPTTAADETDAAYDLVGLLISNDINGEGDVITAADKVASGFTSGLVGTRSYSIDVEAHRKTVEDTGQAILRDGWINGTNVFWLITTATTGDTVAHGQAAVTAYSEANPTNEYATMTASLQGQGAPTYTVVPA